jgi:hypothetical protein
MDAVARAGSDRDATARGSPDGRGADAIVDDADRLGDGHHAIAGGVEHVDLAAAAVWVSAKAKVLQGAARVHAPLSVPTGNPSPVRSRLRGRGGKAAGEKSRGDDW